MTTPPDALPNDLEALKAALLAERSARIEAEVRASGAAAMVAHLKLMIAKLKHERFGPSSEHRRRLLDQLELQLEELEATAAEDACAAEAAAVAKPRRDESVVPGTGRRRPARHRCRRICRVRASSSRRLPSARAVRGSWSSSARTSPRRWR